MANQSIDLPAALAGQIRREAAAAGARECCGLIEGARDGGNFRITALHPARNLAVEADRFEIDPRDHLAAGRAARANGHGIIGCYHSHPAGLAEPSARDLAGAAEDNFLWLIAGHGELAGFVYSNGVYLRGEFTGADWVTSSK